MAWQNGAILMVDYNSWPSIIYGTLPNIAYVTMLLLFFQVRSITTWTWTSPTHFVFATPLPSYLRHTFNHCSRGLDQSKRVPGQYPRLPDGKLEATKCSRTGMADWISGWPTQGTNWNMDGRREDHGSRRWGPWKPTMRTRTWMADVEDLRDLEDLDGQSWGLGWPTSRTGMANLKDLDGPTFRIWMADLTTRTWTADLGLEDLDDRSCEDLDGGQLSLAKNSR